MMDVITKIKIDHLKLELYCFEQMHLYIHRFKEYAAMKKILTRVKIDKHC